MIPSSLILYLTPVKNVRQMQLRLQRQLHMDRAHLHPSDIKYWIHESEALRHMNRNIDVYLTLPLTAAVERYLRNGGMSLSTDNVQMIAKMQISIVYNLIES